MLLVDSSVWIDYLRGRRSAETDLLDDALQGSAPLVGDLILAEVLQGIRDDGQYRSTRARMLELPFTEIGGRDVALAAVDHYRALRARGITPRKTVDLMIAAHCILHGHELLHSDQDFDPFEQHRGLRVARAS
jgi:predicted nucleic acid-binding protein